MVKRAQNRSFLMVGEVHGMAAGNAWWLDMAAQISPFISPPPLRRRRANIKPTTESPTGSVLPPL